MDFSVIIPARYASQRLPGKPLLDIAGKPMIQHVYQQACLSGAKKVVVATDDQRIFDVVSTFGDAVMTSVEHSSGTSRLAECTEILGLNGDDIVVNLQGDEPLMPPSLITEVVEHLTQHPKAVMATLATPITDAEILFDPNSVKVVFDSEGYALYFSRAPIPWHRDQFSQNNRVLLDNDIAFRHLGIYAYRVGFLERYIKAPSSQLEKVESLEQLKVLWMGEKISVGVTNQAPPVGVDTESDLECIRQLFK